MILDFFSFFFLCIIKLKEAQFRIKFVNTFLSHAQQKLLSFFFQNDVKLIDKQNGKPTQFFHWFNQIYCKFSIEMHFQFVLASFERDCARRLIVLSFSRKAKFCFPPLTVSNCHTLNNDFLENLINSFLLKENETHKAK